MSNESEHRCDPACVCRVASERAEIEAGLFDLVEDGVLILGVSQAGRLVYREAYVGALSEPLQQAATSV